MSSPAWQRVKPIRRALRVYATLAAGLVGLTLVLDRLESRVDLDLALLMPYVLLVVLAARWAGLSAAIFTCLVTAPLVAIFLLERPPGRLVLLPREAIQLLLVLSGGLLLSWLVDRLRSERERARAAADAERLALEERDALLSVIAHDLRSPLTAIKARAQMAELALKRQPPDVEAALRYLGAAMPQVDRVGRLLNDLVTTGRGDGGTLEVTTAPLDLTPLLRRVTERWRADAPSHTFETEVAAALPVRGDAGRLEQVLDNLLANAVKYSPRGSTIRLSGRLVDGEVRLAVTDQGTGIPPDEQAQLFERFYRRPEHRAGRQPGLGLGLYITRELVAAHGGRVWVESEVGRGSTFRVSLPLPERIEDSDADASEAPEAERGAATQRTVA